MTLYWLPLVVILLTTQGQSDILAQNAKYNVLNCKLFSTNIYICDIDLHHFSYHTYHYDFNWVTFMQNYDLDPLMTITDGEAVMISRSQP